MTAERALTRALGASCNTAVGARAASAAVAPSGRQADASRARRVCGWVGLPDGSEWMPDAARRRAGRGSVSCVAERMLAAGARELLARAEAMRGRGVTVYLVGAGPGDPGLMTARALELIAAADVIVYDRLIPDGALDGARGDAQLIYAGKEGGGPSMPAGPRSTRLLLEHGAGGARSCGSRAATRSCSAAAARRRRRCARAGIPFEVVPGVTAGIAAPAYAGIPVTHRDAASAVAFLTGHEDPTKAESALDWGALAAVPGDARRVHGGARSCGAIARAADRRRPRPPSSRPRSSSAARSPVSAPCSRRSRRSPTPPSASGSGAGDRVLRPGRGSARAAGLARAAAACTASASPSRARARRRAGWRRGCGALGAEVVEAR